MNGTVLRTIVNELEFNFFIHVLRNIVGEKIRKFFGFGMIVPEADQSRIIIFIQFKVQRKIPDRTFLAAVIHKGIHICLPEYDPFNFLKGNMQGPCKKDVVTDIYFLSLLIDHNFITLL